MVWDEGGQKSEDCFTNQRNHSFKVVISVIWNWQICNTEALWEQIYEAHCDTVTDEMRSLAHEMGWKRMFFTNKLQLQVSWVGNIHGASGQHPVVATLVV